MSLISLLRWIKYLRFPYHCSESLSLGFARKKMINFYTESVIKVTSPRILVTFFLSMLTIKTFCVNKKTKFTLKDHQKCVSVIVRYNKNNNNENRM